MRLKWDEVGKKFFETGTSKGVIYPQKNGEYPKGAAWSGLSGFTLSPSGAEATPIYADDVKYLNLMSAEEVGATIECYMAPPEFDECNGFKEVAPGALIGQQTRVPFGLCVKTLLGNDTKSNDHGYKLHLLYGCMASPSEKAYESVNNDPQAMTASYEISTTPVNVSGFKPTAYMVVDSTNTSADKLKALEDVLYGTENADARLPLPEEVATILTTGKSSASDAESSTDPEGHSVG